MNNFIYHNPTKMIFGEGVIEQLSSQLNKEDRILILYGGQSAKKTGTLDQVKQQLANFIFFEFGGIEPNPNLDTLLKAVKIVKENKITFLLAIGGGSVIDGTKFIALATKYNGDPWHILETRASCCHEALPLGVVLTAPGTGSEMNIRGVVSRRDTQDKLAFASPLVYPKFSLLDPTKTYTLSKHQLSNGLVDSFVHALEQYLTYPVNAILTDHFAEAILQTLIEIAPNLLKDEHDYDARANFMWASSWAINGILETGVPGDWSTHKIGHEITALYGIDHGRTLAIVLPGMLKTRKEFKREKLITFAKNVWHLQANNDDVLIDLAIAKTEQFFNQVGTPTKLSAYNLAEKDIDAIVENLARHIPTGLGERGDITSDTVRVILHACL